ncbi:MAG: ACP S-malonyltransferase [Coriobacteriales bacterium]|jgi:[acyl-carrier-protein] S-malonyltransferase|nr:ACP S-malonyltransferase [Coriobacteriales bacterium]
MSTPTAWLYAGQGSQTPGMGHDFYELYPQVRPLFDSDAAGFDLAAACFEASADELADTRITQPCMAAFAAAVTLLLREAGLAPQMTAGLSLGEYGALHAAGVFDAETLISLLAFRGARMAEAAASAAGGMCAVLGLADADVEAAVAEAAAAGLGVVACANYNCPGQVVIAGEPAAVEKAAELCQARGAKRCLPLATSGAFHTPLMAVVQPALQKRLAQTELAPQKVPVVFNATAAAASDDQVAALLVRQLIAPVRFAQSILALRDAGIRRVIEIGPGKALSGFIRKTAPELECRSIQVVEDLQTIIADWGDNLNSEQRG